jgi:L-ascorbate metabolism protein UlaG (beta-lactamase superfamily)
MELTKYTHACVVLADGARRLLVDPGTWSEPGAFEGVSEVLVTHDHFDHLDVERLVRAGKADSSFVVFGPSAVAEQLRALGAAAVAVEAGQEFTVAGFAVRAVGGTHAEIYDGAPGTSNLGYLIEGGVYHPGDALHVPTEPVETLLLPACAPWLKLAEAIDFVRAVGPARAHPIHEAMLSDVGQASTDRWLDLKSGTEYSRIPIGQTVTV